MASEASVKFSTEVGYNDRPSKARYVHEKYKDILKGSVLDVGSDECHLKSMLPADTRYIGVGLGGSPDIEVNLEKEKLPFENREFECVLCLDVLEHLDNIHFVFDELCRVANSYVLISLPNPYYDFLAALTGSEDMKEQSFKYYGLPVNRPDDRHRWFFSSSEARHFMAEKAKENGFEVIQIDSEGSSPSPNIKSHIKRLALKMSAPFLAVPASDLYERRSWAVLKRQAG